MAVRIEKSDHVTTVIHSRAEARNAMDPASADALVDAFLAFEADDDAHVAVLWGEGGAFCSGWDLKFVSRVSPDDLQRDLVFPDDDPPDANAVPRGPLGPTRLELTKPVIAAVAGPAVAGGMELALWCDIRVMEDSAYIGVYCRRWGIPLIDGGTVRLPRLVGQGRALEIIMTGRKVEAGECLRIGACERVVADGTSRAAAEVMAHEIARFPQVCVRADRRSAIRQHGKSGPRGDEVRVAKRSGADARRSSRRGVTLRRRTRTARRLRANLNGPSLPRQFADASGSSPATQLRTTLSCGAGPSCSR